MDCPDLRVPHCDPATLTCVQCLSANDCDDMLFCTGAETCENQACVTAPLACPDTLPVCNEAADRCDACGPLNPCASDGNACNGAETCNASGVCESGAITLCPLGQQCDPTSGACACNATSCLAPRTCAPSGNCVQTFTFVVAANDDDVLQDPGGSIPITHAWMSLYDAAHWGGFRFSLAGLPARSNIEDAWLHVYLDSDTEDVAEATVWGEDADNAAVFAAITNNVTNRTRVAGGVAWSQDYALPTAGGWVDTSNLGTLVQAHVNRTGYTPGAYLGLILNNSPSNGRALEIRQRNFGTGTFAASLVVRVQQ
jgi:hypothetical protein